MAKIVRVGVTFPPDLLKELDETIEKMRYYSRSKAIQDAVRSFLTEYQLLQKQKGPRAGVLACMHAGGCSSQGRSRRNQKTSSRVSHEKGS